jgi:hypothetical protein
MHVGMRSLSIVAKVRDDPGRLVKLASYISGSPTITWTEGFRIECEPDASLRRDQNGGVMPV